MKDAKREKPTKLEDSTKDVLLELLERAKKMDENIDDHQGHIIGDRLGKLPATKE